MKKTLLATSAIVGAAAIASAAHAETALTITGGVEYQWHFFSVEDDAGHPQITAGTIDSSGNDIRFDDAYLHFKGEATNEESGLTYGFLIDFVPGAANTTDESYVYFKGGFGTVHIGDDDNAIDNTVSTGAGVLAGSGGFDGDIFDFALADTGLASRTGPGNAGFGGDNSRVTYYSPDFSGFSVAASFTPQPDNFDSTTARTNVAGRSDEISVAAKFGTEIAGAGIALSGGVVMADTAAANTADTEAYELGAKVTFGDLSAAVGYGYDGDSNASTANATKVDDVYYVDAGVAYAFGDVSVSAGAFFSEADANHTSAGSVVTSQDYTFAWSVGVSYSGLGSGVSVYADYGQRETYDASNDGSGTMEDSGFLVGTKVNF